MLCKTENIIVENGQLIILKIIVEIMSTGSLRIMLLDLFKSKNVD